MEVELTARAFMFWSELLHRFVVEAGEFVIEVGTDSRTIVASQSVTIDAPPVGAPLSERSSLEEWLADEQGHAILRRMADAGQLGIIDMPESLAVIGNFPMLALTNFGEMGLSKQQLAEALAEVRR